MEKKSKDGSWARREIRLCQGVIRAVGGDILCGGISEAEA